MTRKALLIRHRMARSVSLLGLFAASVLGSACSTAPAQREQMKLDLAVSAKDTVNPDDKGRPSPVLVRVYELKTDSAFENADYYSLEKSDKTLLTQDLLARDEFILRPGESRDIERKLNPDTQAIGILVGYRELGKATWRSVYKLPPAPDAAWYRMAIPARKVKLQVSLDQQTITISKPD
ncbi:type VI secretion system lipoprotein TssJ [Cupriavidus necator H16]|uniref:Type VI secretion system lipoprotein TssJ n=2 Tax=Cupriavidus necator (strain ATCC 17699 / DSM 428 / KCTC 22496 / NCIMB 10442 / H16 / Stanier 337) TaxID=381666 RepID=A0AAE6DF48_CUPNH|nr:type VI secretion system lipoprotein TssJ [Cupriavidus necator H16]QQB77444.1 type VI secretion system lipoprotein TssJ [Cupriavidus necator]